MSVSLQGMVVIGIVGAALCYVLYAAWQTLAGKRTGCGCGSDTCEKK